MPVKDSTAGITATTYTYDTEGRVTSVTQAGGAQGTRATTYTYDCKGRLQTTTDPAGRTDSLYYDSAGRVTKQVFDDGRVVLYEYDSNGNLTGITPPDKPEHSFTYDGDNRPLSYTPPIVPVDSLTPTLYEYDNEGRLKKTTFADSTFIEVVYDTVDGKQRSVAFDRGTTTFDYDSASGNLVRIIGVDDDTLQYTYDGSLPIDEIWGGEVNGRFTVKYDNSFRVIQEKVNGVDSISILYDKDDLPTKVGLLSLKYNTTNGLLLSDTVGSVITDYGYSSFGELTGIKARKGTDTLFSTSYTRDSLGRITSLHEKVQGIQNTFAYSYDLGGRLEEVYRNDTLISAYSYDDNGNRISHTTVTDVDSGSYDAQDRLISYSGKSYVHTPNGYLRYKIDGADSTTFTYDNYGNLVSARLPDGTWVQYLIDAANRRIGKKVDSVIVQKFLYSGDLRIVADLDSADQITTRYVYTTRENVPEYMVRAGTTYRFVLDHLGSVRLVINSSTGDIVQRLDYDEFGHVFLDSNPGFQPFGFAGGQFEKLASLVRFGARDYEAETGRWTGKDPIGFDNSDANLFAYCSGDPVNNIDEWGSDAELAIALFELAFNTLAASTEQAVVKGLAQEDYVAFAKQMLVGAGVFTAAGFVAAMVSGSDPTPVGQLIRGRLKRSKSYHKELEHLSADELKSLRKQGGTVATKAKQMLKLVQEEKRLIQKRF